MMQIKSIVILFLFSGVGSGFCQEIYFRHYQVEDGLSHNSIVSSLQDERGFLWFGTKDGLNRFDGYTFKLFQHDPDNPGSIGSNNILCMQEANGYLYFGTENGLYRYNTIYENFNLVGKTFNSPILDIEVDGEGNLWYIAGTSLFKYNPNNQAYIEFSKKNFFEPASVTRTATGEIWVASYKNLYYYTAESNSFTEVNISITRENSLPFFITTLFALSDNEILIGTQNQGIIKYNRSTASFSKLLTDVHTPLYVRDFELKGDGEIWIATESGIYIYNVPTTSYQHLTKSYNNPYTLSDNAIYTLTLDNEGGMWIGTYFGGINYFPRQYTPFKKYFPKIGENSLGGNVVREIRKDKHGNLWIGTEDNGLNMFNTQTGHFNNFKAGGEAGSISYDNIHGLLPIDDMLLIGTFEHGLDVMNIGTGKVIRHFNSLDSGQLLSNFVYLITKNSQNEIIILTALGMQKYDSATQSFQLVTGFEEPFFYTAYLEDHNGNQWAGTYRNGLHFYNPETHEKKIFKYDSINSTGISNNTINGIFEDSRNYLWITTENGLNQFDPETSRFRHYSTRESFPSNVTYAILEDNRNHLWISTSKGLVEFNPENQHLKTFTKANGLLSDQFNFNSAFKAEDGRLYFGCVDGMISFNPANFSKNTYQAPVYITGMRINNEEVNVNQNGSPLSQSVTSIDQIVLQNRQSSFSLNFAALSYAAPEMSEYWYKLEGLNSDWIPLNRNHQVYFTELAAGSYLFRVKSQNRFGVLSGIKSPLSIRVLPPFYASQFAYAIYFTIVAILLFFLLRYYHRRNQSRNEQRIKQLNNTKEREIYQAKIEFFTNVAHEIRTPLTLINAPLEKMIQKSEKFPEFSKDLSIMEKNTVRLLDLVNQLLDFRKTEMASVNLTFVRCNISELIRGTYLRFSQTIKNKNIDFQLHMDQADLSAFVDGEAIKKILSNLFSNAIKYAEHQVIVTLESISDQFVLTIQNDGYLIPYSLKEKIFEPFFRIEELENQPGSGIGLSLAYSLTELHSGKLILDMEDPNLNTFVLTMPVHQENEFELYRDIDTDDVEPSGPPGEISSDGQKSTLLLVENNEELLDFLSKDLSDNYRVLKAINAELALEIIANQNIQLIVSDVMMAGMSGFEFCRRVKTNLESSHIPLILLTAKDALNSKIEGLESGADAYIAKPFSVAYLKVQIYNLIQNRQHIIEHYSSSPLSHIRSIAHSKTDESFIKKLDGIMYENMANTELSVDILADAMSMSRSTLYRKIKDISNLSPNDLINITRLKKAAELLKSGDYKIYEVAEIVGYNSQTSFGRNFQKQFKMTPSEYVNDTGK